MLSDPATRLRCLELACQRHPGDDTEALTAAQMFAAWCLDEDTGQDPVTEPAAAGVDALHERLPSCDSPAGAEPAGASSSPMQGGAEAARRAHIPEVDGSNPSPAPTEHDSPADTSPAGAEAGGDDPEATRRASSSADSEPDSGVASSRAAAAGDGAPAQSERAQSSPATPDSDGRRSPAAVAQAGGGEPATSPPAELTQRERAVLEAVIRLQSDDRATSGPAISEASGQNRASVPGFLQKLQRKGWLKHAGYAEGGAVYEVLQMPGDAAAKPQPYAVEPAADRRQTCSACRINERQADDELCAECAEKVKLCPPVGSGELPHYQNPDAWGWHRKRTSGGG